MPETGAGFDDELGAEQQQGYRTNGEDHLLDAVAEDFGAFETGEGECFQPDQVA